MRLKKLNSFTKTACFSHCCAYVVLAIITSLLLFQRRFDEIDEVSRLTLDGVRNLLDAQLSGNNREGMQKSRADIDNYLLKGVTNHGSTGN